MPISDDHLKRLIDWVSHNARCVSEFRSVRDALLELQQWRSGVEPGTGAPIGRFVVIDPWTDETD